MNFYEYTLTSLQIFLLCFILGTFVDNQFKKLQSNYNLSPLIAGFSQLFTIITITYFIYKNHSKLFETYSPHLIFSSFLFGLQPNMINNFKKIIYHSNNLT